MSSTSIIELAGGKRIDNAQEASLSSTPEIDLLITPDFQSFLEDIDRGVIDSPQILDARLRTAPNKPVAIQGIPLTDSRGGQVIEERSVSTEASVILKEELAAKKALERASSTLDNFRSYLRDILSGNLTDKEELDARIQSGNSGTIIATSGQTISDSRSVITPQIEILKTSLAAELSLKRNKAEVEDLYGVYSSLSSGDINTNEGVLGYITRRSPKLLEQPEQIGFILEEEKTRDLQSKRKDLLDETYSTCFDILDGNNPGQLDEMASSVDKEVLEFLATVSPSDLELRRGLLGVIRNGETEQIATLIRNRRNNVVSASDLRMLENQSGQLTFTVVPELRRLYLERKITNDLLSSRSVPQIEEVRSEISRIESLSINDEPLISRLDKLTDERQKQINTLEAYRLAARNGTTDAIIYVLNIEKPATDNRYSVLLERLYKIEFATFASNAYKLILSGASNEEFDQFLEQQAQRRPAAGIDFTSEFTRIRTKIDDQAKYVSDLNGVVGILNTLESNSFNAESLIERINELFPAIEDQQIQQSLLQRLKRYVGLRKNRQSDNYDFLFGDEREDILKLINAENYNFNQNLGRNYQASRFLSGQYKKVIQPLFESLRGNKAVQAELEQFVFDTSAGGFNTFRINLERLSTQRELTEVESSYLSSVELLSFFNPQIIGLARKAPEILSVYLENHFTQQDAQTFESLDEGAYVPLIQIGLGAQGVVSAGEIARYVPDIAKDTLFVDSGELPGGPFAVPKGPGWQLNSKNSTGTSEATLPDINEESERMTVRAYGSPLRWYVGERNAGKDTRSGSINVSADFLPQVDEFSQLLYPNNEEEALTLQLQSAMLTNKTLFRTTFLRWEPSNDDLEGDKIAYFERTDKDGNKIEFSVRTDNIVVASGLGKSQFGISMNSSTSLAVINRSEQLVEAGLRPLLTDSLGAFKLTSSREIQRPKTGKVWTIYGGGNSADTQVENLTGLFGRNVGSRELEKVYVVNEGDFSRRDRYALIKDVNGKNGRPNIVERIEGRVTRVELVETDQGPKVRFYNGNQLIRNRDGNPIVADVGVSAAGFKSDAGVVLAGEDDPRQFLSERYLDFVTLPTNPGVAVADRLKSNPGILLVGTASRTGYINERGIDAAAKFLQLPRDARRALQDNGSENAVAIGIRGQDTQAAMRLFLEERFVRQDDKEVFVSDVGKYSADNRLARNKIDVSLDIQFKPLPQVLDIVDIAPVRDDVENYEAILEGIAFQNLQSIRFGTTQGLYTGTLTLTASIADDTTQISIQDAPEGLPIDIFSNPYFIAYGRQAIKDRKDASKLLLELKIVNGVISPKSSSILAV